LKTPEVVGQQARYLDFPSQFSFEIVHRPGTSHRNSDSLSRRPLGKEYPDGSSEEDSETRKTFHVTIPSENDLVVQPSDVRVKETTSSFERCHKRVMAVESRNFISDEDYR